MTLSKKFTDALKLSAKPQYSLAWQAGLHPTTLSKYVIGYLMPRPNDLRLIKLGKLLGLKPEDIFETDASNPTRQGQGS